MNNKTLFASLFLATFFVFLLSASTAVYASVFPTVQLHNSSACTIDVNCTFGLFKTSVVDAHSNYTFFLPEFEWNFTSNKTTLAKNVYARLFHASGGDFFDFDNPPSEISLLSYNFTFNITNVTGATNSALAINISGNNTAIGTNQTFTLMGRSTFSFFEPFANQTISFTASFPCFGIQDGSCGGFGQPLIFELNSSLNTYVLVNDTTDNTLNITHAELSTEPTNRNITFRLVNNTLTSWRAFRITFSFLESDQTVSGTQQEGVSFRNPSPVYITGQASSGMDPENPPGQGSNFNYTITFNATNRLANYTSSNILARFFLPYQVIINSTDSDIGNRSVDIANLTQTGLYWLPCSNNTYTKIWDPISVKTGNDTIVNSTSNFTMSDKFSGSPSNGANITIKLIDLYFNVSKLNCQGFSNKWSLGNNVSLIFNSTFQIPKIHETNSTSGNANQYNTSVYSSINNSAVKIENASMPNWNDKDASTLKVTTNGEEIPQCGTAAAGGNGTCWSETASIAIQGLESGQNSIGVSFSTPSASTTASTTSTSTESSGGAAVSSTATTYSKTFDTLLPTVTRTVTQGELAKLDTALKEVTIRVAEQSNDVKITVESIDARPATVSDPGTSVYQYVNIDAENLLDENVAEAKVKFEVPRTWLIQNGVTETSISLARFSGGQWNKLQTSIVDSSTNSVTYVAETPGFSTFAIIAGEIGGEVAPAEEVTPTSTEAVPEAEVPVAGGLNNTTLAIIGVVVVVVVGLAAFFTRKKKR